MARGVSKHYAFEWHVTEDVRGWVMYESTSSDLEQRVGCKLV